MRPKASSKNQDLTVGEEDVIQAVILAESFNKRFKPLTTDRPRCLLPICNATLLDWTLESLALAGVQEIFVVCRSHPDLVKNAIKDSKWSKAGSGLKIVPIVTAKETFSPGDALRDVYTHGIISNDFVLVTGDLVSNVKIDEVVRVHKERRKKDPNAIMTMVVKESGVEHRTRSKGESGVFMMDPSTDELLHYEHIAGYPPTKFASIPTAILQQHPEVEIRYDLIDCSIDVCSIEVPSLFQDNFDYGHVRRDFVHGVLTSDILMKSIYCYVAKDGYAARVQDTKSYDAISKDILSRWTFPLVPDDNHPGGHSYEHQRGNKYLPKDGSVILSRTCTIGNNTLVGAHSQIYDNTQIMNSVIGQHCTIDAGCTIRNSYIFDHTLVGPNCVIEQSIIGANVVIREGSTIEKGCLVADGVAIGPRAYLQAFDRVSKKENKLVPRGDSVDDASSEDEDEDSELGDLDQDDLDQLAVGLGEHTNAFVWPRRVSDPEDAAMDEIESFSNRRLMRLGDNASDLDLSDPGSVTSSQTDGDVASIGSSVGGDQSPGSATTPLTATSSLPDAEAEFQFEVTQSLERAFEEGHSLDNAAVELKTLRMASNVPLRMVREAVVATIIDNIDFEQGEAVAIQKAKIEKMIGRWGALINKIGGIDGVETIQILQDYCASSTEQLPFGQLLVTFYQDDIVDDDDVRNWHKLGKSKGEGLKPGHVLENYRKFWLIGARLLQQIAEQESSDDESDEEDEDEDEEEDGTEDESKKEKTSEGESDSEEEDDSEEDEEDEDDDIDEQKEGGKAAERTASQRQQESDEDEDGEASDELKKGTKLVEGTMDESDDGDEDEDEDDTVANPGAKDGVPPMVAPEDKDEHKEEGTPVARPVDESEDESEGDDDEKPNLGTKAGVPDPEAAEYAGESESDEENLPAKDQVLRKTPTMGAPLLPTQAARSDTRTDACEITKEVSERRPKIRIRLQTTFNRWLGTLKRTQSSTTKGGAYT